MFSQILENKTRLIGLILVTILITGAVIFPVSAQINLDAKSFTQIYNEVSPSVVAVSVTKNAAPDQQPFNPDAQVGGGTGFVIDTEGHIVTNFHVVDGANDIEVNFMDGILARAEVVGLDADSDLAVIKVNDVSQDRLHPVTFGDSSALEVGETVLAIGSPFGERWTLTSGIVSALNRTIQGMTQFSVGGVIQTDAAINPGNSGGPLLNMHGEVVGVNSQIISTSRTSSGVGFAIPSNLTRRVAQQLIERGYMEYSYLGISGGNISLNVLETFDLPNDTRGVVVSDVVAGGPAARAGLHSMGGTFSADTGERVLESVDIITGIDGKPINSMENLIGYLAQQTEPGDQITMQILRDGTEQVELVVRLTPRP